MGSTRRFTWGLFSGIFGLLLGAGALSAEAPLRLAFYEYGLLYSQGEGIDKDVVDELVRRTKVEVHSQVEARARIWTDLESGDLDLTVSGIETPARNRFAWFIPYLVMKNHAVIFKPDSASIRAFADFRKNESLRFGVVTSFKHGPQQDRMVDDLRGAKRIEESPDAETLFKKLKAGRISGVFSQPPVYGYYIKLLGLTDSVVVQDWAPEDQGTVHNLVLSKARFSAELVAQWTAVLAEMKRDGTLKRIFAKYLPPAEAAAMVKF